MFAVTAGHAAVARPVAGVDESIQPQPGRAPYAGLYTDHGRDQDGRP